MRQMRVIGAGVMEARGQKSTGSQDLDKIMDIVDLVWTVWILGVMELKGGIYNVIWHIPASAACRQTELWPPPPSWCSPAIQVRWVTKPIREKDKANESWDQKMHTNIHKAINPSKPQIQIKYQVSKWSWNWKEQQKCWPYWLMSQRPLMSGKKQIGGHQTRI